MAEDEQSHPEVMGAFDPTVGYATAMGQLFALVQAVSASPRAVAPREVLRAAQAAVDTLEAITDFATEGLLAQLTTVIDEDVWAAHNEEDSRIKDQRTALEAAQHKAELISRVTPLLPVRVEPRDV